MGLSAVGTVGLVPFPFADLKGYKMRPALVVAQGSLDTIIVCQITSRSLPNVPAITLNNNDFTKGGLAIDSYVRFDKLLTIDATTIRQQLGVVSSDKLKTVQTLIKELFE